jgi:hypothetical protein
VNRYSRLVSGAWALAAVGIAATVLAWSTAVPIVGPEETTVSRSVTIGMPVPQAPDTARLASSARILRDHDPFRLDRTPAAVLFSLSGPISQQVTPPLPAPLRPPLRLVGIIGGPPWTTVVEGVPGRESGLLLRVGEDVGGIRLNAVGRDSAVFSGFDTNWVLRVRVPWH